MSPVALAAQGTESLSFRCTPAEAARLRGLAAASDRSISREVQRMVKQYLESAGVASAVPAGR
jgi:hypothetical protein